MSAPMRHVAPDVPVPARVIARTEEVPDVVTLRLRPTFGLLEEFQPAQFSMIGVAGVGEVPISISSSVDDRTAHAYTIRRSGAVTGVLFDQEVGSVVTVRGPFGRPWDLERSGGRHALFVAGGIGLAPLRAAIAAVAKGGRASRVTVLAGSTTPELQIFRSWLHSLRSDHVDVRLAADAVGATEPGVSWDGHVGYVTDLIARVVDNSNVAAYICGPDAMMTATITLLEHLGVALDDIEVTLERNMQCGTGWCGHCQLGPFMLCRDGPVLRATELGDLLGRPEL